MNWSAKDSGHVNVCRKVERLTATFCHFCYMYVNSYNVQVLWDTILTTCVCLHLFYSSAIHAAQMLVADGTVIPLGNSLPLHLAASEGRTLSVTELINNKICDKEEKDSDGMTPLHHAAKEGRVDTIQALCGLGCNVQATDKGGLIPLHWAAMNGHFEAVKCLVGYDSSTVMTKNNDGVTPYDLARQWNSNNSNNEVIEYLEIVIQSIAFVY